MIDLKDGLSDEIAQAKILAAQGKVAVRKWLLGLSVTAAIALGVAAGIFITWVI